MFLLYRKDVIARLGAQALDFSRKRALARGRAKRENFARFWIGRAVRARSFFGNMNYRIFSQQEFKNRFVFTATHWFWSPRCATFLQDQLPRVLYHTHNTLLVTRKRYVRIKVSEFAYIEKNYVMFFKIFVLEFEMQYSNLGTLIRRAFSARRARSNSEMHF